MSPQRSQGFTLIELLVVMVIIAIIASIGVISVNVADRDPSKGDAHEMADLMGLAAEQAIMQGQEYGLRLETHGYSFYVYDGRRWQPVKDDNLFYRRDLGDDVTLSLQLEGAPATLAPPPVTLQEAETVTSTAPAAATGESEEQKDVPQVLLLSSGELPPFEIDVTGTASKAVFKVKGSLADGICVLEPGQTECKS
ncbi:MAG TPA: type II secretion system minor pseudopilin GspH [Gammaproteobacteria bacterium]